MRGHWAPRSWSPRSGACGRTAWTWQALSDGPREGAPKKNLRYSQVALLSTFEERNTGDNLPAQIEIAAEGELTPYKFLFIAKGGGSANKHLPLPGDAVNPHLTEPIIAFLKDKHLTLGTPVARPPHHLAVVIGGLSAESTLKMVKLASAR